MPELPSYTCSTLVKQALNVPLVAIACAVSEVPAALARWCGASRGCGGERAPSGSPGSSPASVAAAAAASTGLPTEGSVHVAIADESYHPQQLLLMERVKEALGGVALYTVESSCVCPVNTYRGGRAAAAATGPGDFSSLADFRQAQVSCFRVWKKLAVFASLATLTACWGELGRWVKLVGCTVLLHANNDPWKTRTCVFVVKKEARRGQKFGSVD